MEKALGGAPVVPGSAPSEPSVTFEPLVPAPTRSHRIVSAIVQQIRSGGIRRGQKLASETQLAAQFGVSRSVVREAVKLLEAMGVVTSRQGSGSYVRNDPGPAVARVLALAVTGEDSGVAELLELREVLEAAAARLAAQRRTEAQLGELWRQFDATAAATASRDPVAMARADRQFHTVVHRMSGNRYLAVVLAALAEVQSDVATGAEADLGAAEQSVEQHRRLVEWIAVRSPERAAEASGAHVQMVAAGMKRKRHRAG